MNATYMRANKRNGRNLVAAALFGCLVAWGAAGVAAGANARVSLVRGTATVTSEAAGEPRDLHRGDEVQPGDVIQTGSKGVVQIVFSDRTVMYVKADSSVRLESYRFAGSGEDADNSAVTELLKGGMRGITGLVGKANPENVTYKAADTTIGIRGTAIEIDLKGDTTYVTFDYGKGFVETPRPGLCLRTDLTQGDSWILSGSKAKRQFAERAKTDPSYVAQYLTSARAGETRDLAAEAAQSMPLEDVMLVLGMLREVPLFSSAVLGEAVAGFSSAVAAEDVGTLLSGVTMAYPDDAPTILEAAKTGNVDMVKATASVICGLEDQPGAAKQSLIERAVQLGVTPAEARQVLQTLQSQSCGSV